MKRQRKAWLDPDIATLKARQVDTGMMLQASNLISVHDADDLMRRNFDAVGVDLRQSVVQVAGFAVGLVCRPVPP